MIENGADFLKWCQVFGVITGQGGGGVPASFGEMFFAQNLRPTQVPFPVIAWVKPEASETLIPTSPPDYSAYAAGYNKDWTFDAINSRLVFSGARAGYYHLTMTLSGTIDAPLNNVIISFAMQKNGLQFGVLFDKSYTRAFMYGGAFPAVSVACQAADYFVPGDYVEPILLNESDTNTPVINFLNIFAKSIGNTKAPTTPVFLVDENNNNIVDNDDNFIIGEING